MRIFVKRAAIGVAVAALLATALPATVFAGTSPNFMSMTNPGTQTLAPAAFGVATVAITNFSTASHADTPHVFLFSSPIENTPTVCHWILTVKSSPPGDMVTTVRLDTPGICSITITDPGDGTYQAVSATRSFIVRSTGPLTVAANSYTKVYGAADPAFGFAVTAGLIGGADPAWTTPPVCAPPNPHVNVGVYPITCTGGVSPFYTTIGTYIAGALTITPAPAPVVTANSYSLTYGAAAPGAPLWTTAGLLLGDSLVTDPTCISTPAYVQFSPVGTYVTSCSGAVASANYAAPVTYVAGAITVAKKKASVTADDQSKFVGDANPVLTWTEAGFLNSEHPVGITCSTTATTASLAGTYPITCKQANATVLPNSNYDITFVPGTLTVSKKDQHIHASSPSTGRVGTFAALYGVAYDNKTLLPTGLPVAFTSQTPAICRTYGAYGTRVYFTGRGDCTIWASQAGNNMYLPAPTLVGHIWVSRD